MTSAMLSIVLVLLIGAVSRPRPSRRPLGVATHADIVVARAMRPLRAAVHRLHTSRSGKSQPGEVAKWCEELSRAVRSGSSLSSAIRQVEPPQAHREFILRVVHEIDRGVPLATALLGGPSTCRHLDLALVVLQACAAHGGPPAESIDRAACTLRARDTDLTDRRTHSAQARMSAIVMTFLPGVTVLFTVATSQSVRSVLATQAGAILMLVGVGLNIAGWCWMRQIIGRGGE